MNALPRALRAILLLAVAAGCAPHGATPDGEDPAAGRTGIEVAARIGDHEITIEQVDRRARETSVLPYQALYDARREALESLVAEYLIDREATVRGTTRDVLMTEAAGGGARTPTADEIREFYEQNRSRLGGRSFEEASPEIRSMLINRSRQRALNGFMKQLQAAQTIVVDLEPPRAPITVSDDDPAQGPPDAPVTIVEFSDFQCPYCARAIEVVEQVFERYDGRVRLVFRDFPLSFHPRAYPAAEAAQCAHDQGKFWEYHDLLFANQRELSDEDFTRYAVELELDEETFATCMASGRHRGKIASDLNDGKSHGVTGTPAFFINGRFLSGSRSLDDFARIIEDELDGLGRRAD